MKIFFYKYGSICEPDISDSFRRLGFEVIDEDMEIYNKNLLPSQCVETVSKKLIDGQFTFVFTINFFPWLSDLCEIMHLKYISLIVDSPVLELYSYSLKNDCNRIFLFDRCLYNEFEPFNQGHIFHVPLAADINRIQNVIKNASTSEKAKFASDIFIPLPITSLRPAKSGSEPFTNATVSLMPTRRIVLFAAIVL